MESKRRLARVLLAATRHQIFFICSLALGLWSFLSLLLEISFFCNSSGFPGFDALPPLASPDGWIAPVTWPYSALDGITAVSLVGWLIIIFVQPELLADDGAESGDGGGGIGGGAASPSSPGAPSPSVTRRLVRRFSGWFSWLSRGAAVSRRSGNSQNARIGFPVLHLLALTGLALVTASYFATVRPSSTVVGLICLLRAYQMFFMYTTNPLFLMHRAAGVRAMRRQAAFMTTVQLHWVLRSADSLFSVFFELLEIVRETRRLSPNLLHVRIYITAATPKERETIEALAAGTALAGAFVFARPDICAILAAAAQPLAGQSGALATTSSSKLLLDAALNVFVCGNPGLAASARDAFLRVRRVYADKVLLAYGAETVFG